MSYKMCYVCSVYFEYETDKESTLCEHCNHYFNIHSIENDESSEIEDDKSSEDEEEYRNVHEVEYESSEEEEEDQLFYEDQVFYEDESSEEECGEPSIKRQRN